MSIKSTRRAFMRSLALPLLGSVSIKAFDGSHPPKIDRLFDATEIVGRVTGKSAEVNVVSSDRRQFRLLYGKHPERLTKGVRFEGAGSLTVELKGLKPGKSYHYKVGKKKPKESDYSYGETHNFVTQRPPGSPFKFAVFADAHLLGDAKGPVHYANLKRSVEMAAAEDIDFLLFVGDEACLDGSGGKPSSSRFIKSQSESNLRYALLRESYAPVLANKPAFFALGNHDGEVGFLDSKLRNHGLYLPRWGTISRKRYVLNPRPDTYPEGGEDEGWSGPENDPASGGADDGNCSPLENYFAWSWGDALFIVLDPCRYTAERGVSPESWTLGEKQMQWLEATLAQSKSRHKFVIAHHLVGGARWNAATDKPGAYGRGGAEFSHLGEQGTIHQLMRAYDARFFLYGHDHIFRVSARDKIQYVCCGRHTSVANNWWDNKGWQEIYGDDFMALVGYTLVEVGNRSVKVSYKVSGSCSWNSMKGEGRNYRLKEGGTIKVESPVLDVVRVWSPDDPAQRDLYRGGGSFSGRTITLARKPHDGGGVVNAIYVGQVPYKKKFHFKQ